MGRLPRRQPGAQRPAGWCDVQQSKPDLRAASDSSSNLQELNGSAAAAADIILEGIESGGQAATGGGFKASEAIAAIDKIGVDQADPWQEGGRTQRREHGLQCVLEHQAV